MILLVRILGGLIWINVLGFTGPQAVPSNMKGQARKQASTSHLACLNGLAEDAQRRAVMGPGAEIRLHTYDETNRRVRSDRIIRDSSRAVEKGADRLGRGTTNQFPRAVDLARPFRARGWPLAPDIAVSGDPFFWGKRDRK